MSGMTLCKFGSELQAGQNEKILSNHNLGLITFLSSRVATFYPTASC